MSDTAAPATVTTDWLLAQHWCQQLLERAKVGEPVLLAISGAQGSGKSTLAAAFCRQLQQQGLTAAAVSLDDYYLSQNARKQLAIDVHPLLRWRGAPGTHDVGRLQSDLQRHLAGEPIALPQFDKAQDDRLDDRPAQQYQLLVLEGWCLGVGAQSDEQLRQPVNMLELQQDSAGHYRHYVNQQLKSSYEPLWSLFGSLLYLAAPDWPTVLRWRQQQEAVLWQQRGRGMSDTELEFFMQLFERYSVAMLDGQFCAALPFAVHMLRLDSERAVLPD